MAQIYMNDYYYESDNDTSANINNIPNNTPEISFIEIPFAFVFDNTVAAITKCYNCIVPHEKEKKE